MNNKKIENFIDFIKNKKQISIKPNIEKEKKEKMFKAQILVICCSHFSIKDDEFKILDTLGLKDNYDLIVLPGASLSIGYDHATLNKWRKCVLEQIEILKKVHEIEYILLMDHLNCAAYQNFYFDFIKEDEKKIHINVTSHAKMILEKEFPDIKVYRVLLGFDGVLENLDYNT